MSLLIERARYHLSANNVAAAARRRRRSGLRRPLQRRQVQCAQRADPPERPGPCLQDPGRTQQLVFFQVTPEAHLVDLPGYGYAKVPLDLQAHWQAFIDKYFRTREALKAGGGDGHPPSAEGLRPADAVLRRAARPAGARVADQGRQAQPQPADAVPQKVRKELQSAYGDSVSVQVFSGEDRTGVDEARGVIGGWLGPEWHPLPSVEPSLRSAVESRHAER